MKKMYENPFFEITRFSFEEILDNDKPNYSDPEGELPTQGGDFGDEDE